MPNPDVTQNIRSLAELDPDLLNQVIVSATIDGDGKLDSVGGITPKLLETIKAKELPAITHFAMAASQSEYAQQTKRDWRNHVEGRKAPRIIGVSNLVALVNGLDWKGYLREGVVLEDYKGLLQNSGAGIYKRRMMRGQRAWLRERLQTSLKEKDKGYLLLTMPLGWGKTAFIIDIIAHQPLAAAEVVAYHFARRGHLGVPRGGDNVAHWDSVAVLVEQIEARLRLIFSAMFQDNNTHTLVEDDAEKAGGVLLRVLEDITDKIGPNRKVLICIDGLDEIFGDLSYGLNNHLLRKILPSLNNLPTGVFFLLTSRPGNHLAMLLKDQERPVMRFTLEAGYNDSELQQGQEEDIREFLLAEISTAADEHERSQPENGLLLERLIVACECNFFVANWFADRMQEIGLDEMRDPQYDLPKGLNGILDRDWLAAHEAMQNISKNADSLKLLLGLIAIARQTPDRLMICKILSSDKESLFSKTRQITYEEVLSATLHLKLLSGFFDVNLDLLEQPLAWSHSAIPEWVLSRNPGQDPFLQSDDIQNCHSAWMDACQEWALNNIPDKTSMRLRRYAQLWLPYHAALAGHLDVATDTLLDYSGWVAQGVNLAKSDSQFGADWLLAMQECINVVLLEIMNEEQPRHALNPQEYFRYLASSG